MRSTIVRTAVALAGLCSGAIADAAVVSFSGSMNGLGVAGPDASCAPLPFRGIVSPATASGSSSLGGFTYGHNICLSGAAGPSQGVFILDFGAGTLEGTLTGLATPGAIPGTGSLLFSYTVLGGTGKFLDASGSFTGIGTNDARMRPSKLDLAFDGSIDAPAIPEPGTWVMLILGFGISGALIRRRRHTRLGAWAS